MLKLSYMLLPRVGHLGLPCDVRWLSLALYLWWATLSSNIYTCLVLTTLQTRLLLQCLKERVQQRFKVAHTYFCEL